MTHAQDKLLARTSDVAQRPRAAAARRGRLRPGHGHAEMVRHMIDGIMDIVVWKRAEQLEPRAHHGGVRGVPRGQ